MKQASSWVRQPKKHSANLDSTNEYNTNNTSLNTNTFKAEKKNKKEIVVHKKYYHGTNRGEKLSQNSGMINNKILQLKIWQHFLLFIYLLTFPCKSLGTTTTETFKTTTACVCPPSGSTEQPTIEQKTPETQSSIPDKTTETQSSILAITTETQSLEQQTTEYATTTTVCICPEEKTTEPNDILSTLSEVETSTEIAENRHRKRKQRRIETNLDMFVDDFDQKIIQKLPFAKFA